MLRALLVVLSVLTAPGCSPERAHSYLHLSHPPHPRCGHPVALIPAGAPVLYSYRELASISVTCRTTAPEDCDVTLLARGCDLGADAVWVRSTSYVRGSGVGRASESGVALQYTSSAVGTN